MKKVLAVILSVMMLVSLTACGNAADKKDDATTPTTVQKTEAPASSATPLEIMNKIFGSYTPEFSIYGGDYTNAYNEETGAYNYDGVAGPVNVGNEEAGLENLFICSPDAQALIDDAASAINAMMSNHFTAVTYHLKDASSAESFATLMTDSFKNNHWMCGAPEKIVITAVDSNNIVVVFGLNDAVNPFMDQVKSAYSGASVLAEEELAL